MEEIKVEEVVEVTPEVTEAPVETVEVEVVPEVVESVEEAA